MASSELSEKFEGMFITERDQEVKQVDDSILLRYKTDFTKKPTAVIINNKKFEDGLKLKQRDGSEKDVTCMTDVLKNLGFDVLIKKDMTVKQMKILFKDIQQTDHTDKSCFLAVIMSHGGDDDVIFGVDGKITITELVECLLPDVCKSLTGKPKLFFIQAYRGSKQDKGVEVRDGRIPEQKKIIKIPLWADVLISYSSVPGYYSSLNKLNGSWYIQSLADVLQHHGKNKELATLLTMVNAKVALEYESKHRKNIFFTEKCKEMPAFSSMLTRELYFQFPN